jgi:hypothetical protein
MAASPDRRIALVGCAMVNRFVMPCSGLPRSGLCQSCRDAKERSRGSGSRFLRRAVNKHLHEPKKGGRKSEPAPPCRYCALRVSGCWHLAVVFECPLFGRQQGTAWSHRRRSVDLPIDGERLKAGLHFRPLYPRAFAQRRCRGPPKDDGWRARQWLRGAGSALLNPGRASPQVANSPRSATDP